MSNQVSYQSRLDCCYAMILVAREDPDTSTDFANRFIRFTALMNVISSQCNKDPQKVFAALPDFEELSKLRPEDVLQIINQIK